MIPISDALELCQGHIDAWVESGQSAAEISIIRAELHVNGWVFYFQSSKFLQTGNWVDMLGGNTPLLVKDDGSVLPVGVNDEVETLAGAVLGQLRRTSATGPQPLARVCSG